MDDTKKVCPEPELKISGRILLQWNGEKPLLWMGLPFRSHLREDRVESLRSRMIDKFLLSIPSRL
jgi:hypothetical protein